MLRKYRIKKKNYKKYSTYYDIQIISKQKINLLKTCGINKVKFT